MRARLARTLARSLCAAFPLLTTFSDTPAGALPVPRLDHVVVVVMENKSYDQVRVQPYTAGLIAGGASFPASYAVTHPSQPNYLALWAGSTLGVTNDNCPPAGALFPAENLGHACEAAGLTWRAYSENLPAAGATGCSYDGNTSSGLSTRKHDPWTDFANLDHAQERPYADLASDLAAGTLPNLAFVIPNNCHNTHNSSTAGCGLADGDAWLAANLPPLLAGLGPRGLLVLTWDEDDSSAGNHVLTVFAGPAVPASTAQPLDHYGLVRAICQALGLAPFGLAASRPDITDVWAVVVPTAATSWGKVKALYR